MLGSRKFRVFRILLVEDDEQFAKFVLTALNQFNLFVRHAADGRLALKFLKEEPFDLMICDIGMPHMDGFKLMEKSQTQNLSIPPILMLTGYKDRDTVLKAKAFGAFGYITKPATLDQILAKVREAIQIPEGALLNKSEMPFRVDCAKIDGTLQVFMTGCPKKDPVDDIKKEILTIASQSRRISEALIQASAELACEGRAMQILDDLAKYIHKQLLIPWSSIRFKGSFFEAISIIEKEKFQTDHMVVEN